MFDDKKLDKLEKLINLVDEDYVKSDEFVEVFGVLVSLIKESNDSSEESIESLKKQAEYIREVVLSERKLSRKLQEQFNNRLASFKTELENAIYEVKEILPELREAKDGVDGKDGRDGKDGKDGSPDTGEQIVEKINSLDEKAPKIDASHIKNLPQTVTTIVEQGGRGFVETPIKAGSNVTVTKDASGAWVINSTATGGAGLVDGDYGDITVGGSGTTMTIDNGVVTLAKQADVATGTVFYRKTAGTGSPEVQTLATLKTDLGLTGTNSGDVTVSDSSEIDFTLTGQQISASLIAGSIANSKLANSAITITGTSTSLGGTITQDTITGLSSTGIIKRTGANTLAIATADTDYLTPGTASSTYQPLDTQLTSLAGLSYTGNANKVVRVNAGETGFELATVSAGGGDVTKVGTPVNNQIGVWTGDGTIEGDASLTWDGTSFNIATAKNFQIAGATILADAAGTTTLSNIDALDATTEATIEAAIDTLANLTSIQGRTVTLADAGANAFFGWDDVSGAYENLSQAEARTILGLGTAAYVATDLADLNEATIETAIDTLANLTSVQGLTVTLADAGADALFGWDDSASAYQNLSAADAKTALSLNNVENTALSTWTGSANIATVGTIGTGVWQGTTIKANYLQQAAADLGDADITVDLSNSNAGNVTNLTIDGALTIASMGGNWTNASRTIADLGTVTTADINGGTIDGVTIGGASAGAITGTSFTVNTDITIPNTGLHILDTNASHDLIIKPGSDLTADKTLTVTTGDADVTLNLTAVTDEYVLAYDTGTSTWRGVAATSGANTALSNLASVAINTTLVSDTDNTDALGTAAISWSDLFLGDGSVITWSTAPSTADITLTHTTNRLTLAGGDMLYSGGGLVVQSSVGSIVGVNNSFSTTQSLNVLTTSTTSTEAGHLVGSGTTTVRGQILSDAPAVTLTADNAYARFILGNSGAVTEAGSGTHPLVSYLAIKPLTITNGAGATTVAATVYIEGAATGTATPGSNYALLVDSGVSAFGGNIIPDSNDVASLGISGTAFSDLFLASGGVINWNSGNATLTHSSGLLTSNVSLSLGTSNTLTTGTIELGNASDTTLSRSAAGKLAVEGVEVLTVAGGTLTGNITLGENTSIDLDPAGSADGKYSGICITGTAGAALAFGDLIYLAAADSRWELADADAASTADRMLGICVLAAAADGNATKILLHGNIRADAAFPALTIGSPVYVGETAGDVQVAIPTGADNIIRRVGYALTADELYFCPSMDSQVTVA